MPSSIRGPNFRQNWLASWAAVGLVFLAACSSGPGPASRTPTPSRTATFLPTFTPSPSPSATRTLTPLPSRTPTVTTTPSPTATNTRPPTLTAAVPRRDNDAYDLREWTVAAASHQVELMESYPDVLYPEARRAGNAQYFDLFRFAILAEGEALLRFPNAPLAERWSWNRGFNLARSADPRVGEYYAALIREALNKGETQLDELNAWFADHEPRLALRPIALEPLPGSISTTLLELRGQGSAYFLVVETPGEFQVQVLASLFDYADPVSYDFAVGDLTLDGIAEIVIYPRQSATRTDLPLPRVIDLSQTTPLELGFRPTDAIAIGLQHQARWRPAPLLSGGNDLIFETSVFPACPVEISDRFHWSGSWFESVERRYQLQPALNLLQFCDPLFNHAITVWDPAVSARLLETALAALPPTGDLPANLPGEMIDAWRFRLGVYRALIGDRDAAIAQLQDLIDQPISVPSPSARQASQFLANYSSDLGLYSACEQTVACNLDLAFSRLVETTPPEDFGLILDRMALARVPVRQSGYFDFDGDGESERWVTIRHLGRDSLEFWVLARSPQAVRSLLVEEVAALNPSLTATETPTGEPVFQLAGHRQYILRRLPDDREPYLVLYQPEIIFTSERVRIQNQEALQRLLAGESPTQIRDELVALQASPIFGCTYSTCPDFIYPLALAHELAGDERSAVDLYLELWRVYPRSLYTILARLKLVGEALLPTSTPTLTPTITLTPSLTPTVTGTPPTPTPTQSGTPFTATPTQTGTPPTGTPTPTVTATFTPTQTPTP